MSKFECQTTYVCKFCHLDERKENGGGDPKRASCGPSGEQDIFIENDWLIVYTYRYD